MKFSNPELEKEISDFFEQSKSDFDAIFAELGLETKRIEPDDCERFLAEREQLLAGFERHLYEQCSILKELDGQNGKLSEQLNERIAQLIAEEQTVMGELEELRATKENLRKMLDVKSAVIQESIERKKEIERNPNGSVKEEFVRLCKFMNLKFQWNQIEKKFTIVFLSGTTDVNQVKQINGKKLLENDQQYIKELRDHFKRKIFQMIK